MAVTPFGSFKTALGVAKEATPGTFVPPTHYIPIMAPKVVDNFKWYEDKAYRSLAAEIFGHYQLTGIGALDFNGPFYPDAPGYFLYNVLGQDTASAAPTPTTQSGASVVGATSITLTSATGFVKGEAILIDSGALQETNVILSMAGAVATLAMPLRFAHAGGNTIAGNNLHQLQMAPSASVAQVPTFSFWDFYGENQRQWTNGLVSDLELKWNADTEVTYSAKCVANPSALSSVQTPAYSSNVSPFSGWQVGTIIAGSAQSNLLDVSLSFKRKILPLYGMNNQQGPVAIIGTVLALTGKATAIMTNEAELNHFRNADNPTITIALAGNAPGIAGAPSASGLMIQMSNAQFTLAEVQRSKDEVEVAIDFAPDYNATDAGPCIAYLTNAYVAFN